jgi:CRISPR-associated endonuclease Csn1
MKKRTLGLDLGTNSIGWCLVEDGKRIVDIGVRIFPIGLQADAFAKAGKEISKNVDRRMKRGARRRRWRYILRRTALQETLALHGMLPAASEIPPTQYLYEIRRLGLDNKLSLSDIGRILLMLNKRRGFKSNRKVSVDKDAIKEEGIVKESIRELEAQMTAAECRTVGEYFATLFDREGEQEFRYNRDEPLERIRKRWVSRELYMREFELLWEAQAAYYPDVLTEDLKILIRDRIIYYQRKLKSQKGSVGRCRYEPGKRCAPISTEAFQEYRILQQLGTVRLDYDEQISQRLTHEQQKVLAEVLMRGSRLTKTAALKMLGLPKHAKLNDIFPTSKQEFFYNTTAARIGEAIGQETYGAMTSEQRFELWHLLSYGDEESKMATILRRKIKKGYLPSLNDDQIKSFLTVSLEEGYGNLSAKALGKILPILRNGCELKEAVREAGYSWVRDRAGSGEGLDRIPPLAPNELRNPIVQQMLSETFRLINAVTRAHGKPDMIRIELARELKKPKAKREESRQLSKRKRELREDYAEFLSVRLGKKVYPNSSEVTKYELWLELGCEDDSLNSVESFMKDFRVNELAKFKLWKECNRISPYTGRVITLGKLFSPEIEIEHILPYSKTMNNEYGNLSLCESSVNREKGKMLPYLYFQSLGEAELAAFKRRIAIFPQGKRLRFLATEIPDGFLNSQLTNTSYAAVQLVEKLEAFLPPAQQENGSSSPRIQVTNGQATSTLRRLWALNEILSEGDPKTKNRGDHRHHAVDALVIACSGPSVIKTLANYSSFDELSRLRNDSIRTPWKTFRSDANDAVMGIIVSHRCDKRLVEHKPNIVAVKKSPKNPEGQSRQNSLTIRGPLHDETLYGQIEIDGEREFVTRWPLEKFTDAKQIDRVVDAKVREVLRSRIKDKGGNVVAAFRNLENDPIYMYSILKNGKMARVPIRRVRVRESGEHLQRLWKKPGAPEAYIKTGNNYCIAIYEHTESGERDYETLTFWAAVIKSIKGEPLVPEVKNGANVMMVLKQGDTVVRYSNHPDEIRWDDMDYLRENLFKVRKFDVVGQIFFDSIYAAKIDDKADRNVLYFQQRYSTCSFVKVNISILGEFITDLA